MRNELDANNAMEDTDDVFDDDPLEQDNKLPVEQKYELAPSLVPTPAFQPVVIPSLPHKPAPHKPRGAVTTEDASDPSPPVTLALPVISSSASGGTSSSSSTPARHSTQPSDIRIWFRKRRTLKHPLPPAFRQPLPDGGYKTKSMRLGPGRGSYKSIQAVFA
jgi:hypothetical protein